MKANCGPLKIFRNYPDAKLQENLDAEIFGVVAEEARMAFDDDEDGETGGTTGGMVVELKSETAEDVDSNCERILKWIETWVEDRQKEKGG